MISSQIFISSLQNHLRDFEALIPEHNPQKIPTQSI